MAELDGKKVEAASQDEYIKLEVEVDRILETVAEIVHAPEIIGAFITDESILGDLMPLDWREDEQRDQFLNELSAELNTKVKSNEFIINIAKRIDV